MCSTDIQRDCNATESPELSKVTTAASRCSNVKTTYLFRQPSSLRSNHLFLPGEIQKTHWQHEVQLKFRSSQKSGPLSLVMDRPVVVPEPLVSHWLPFFFLFFLAVILIKQTFAQTDRFRGYFNQFIMIDEFKGLFQGQLSRGGQTDCFVTP